MKRQNQKVESEVLGSRSQGGGKECQLKINVLKCFRNIVRGSQKRTL